MRIFLLKLGISLVILGGICMAVLHFTSFSPVNAIFMVGIISCFFTYGGKVSTAGEVSTLAGIFGGYKPRNSSQEEFVSPVSPYFASSLLTIIASLVLLLV